MIIDLLTYQIEHQILVSIKKNELSIAYLNLAYLMLHLIFCSTKLTEIFEKTFLILFKQFCN